MSGKVLSSILASVHGRGEVVGIIFRRQSDTARAGHVFEFVPLSIHLLGCCYAVDMHHDGGGRRGMDRKGRLRTERESE